MLTLIGSILITSLNTHPNNNLYSAFLVRVAYSIFCIKSCNGLILCNHNMNVNMAFSLLIIRKKLNFIFQMLFFFFSIPIRFWVTKWCSMKMKNEHAKFNQICNFRIILHVFNFLCILLFLRGNFYYFCLFWLKAFLPDFIHGFLVFINYLLF